MKQFALGRYRYSLWAFSSALCFCFSSSALGVSVAEMTYTLLNGDCPKEQNLNSERGSFHLFCLVSAVSPRAARLLKRDLGDVGENAYFVALADERRQALRCSQSQISDLQNKPQDLDLFAADISEKLIALLKEKKRMDELRPALGYGASTNENPKDAVKAGSPMDEYKKARARAEAILSYLPFTQAPAMQKLIAHITSQTDYVANGSVDPEIEKSIQDMIKKTMPIVQGEIGKSLRSLDDVVETGGHSLDDLTRESLAQDTELVESLHRKNLRIESDLKPIACRVDAKYGKGAQYRDTAFLAATVLGTAFTAGFPALAVRLGMTAESASAVTAGRSFGILRASSWAMDMTLTAKQIKRACFSDLSDLGGTLNSGNRCESSVLTSLANDNCTLATVVNSLGAPGLFKNSVLAAKVAGKSAKRAKTLSTPAGRLAEEKNHFAHFQDLMQSGQKAKAENLEKEVKKILSTTEMEVVKDIGGTSKGGGKFVRFSDGTLGVWKPAKMKEIPFRGMEVASSEIAAYKLDRFLGLNQIPTVVERELNGEKGVVSVMVGGLKKQPLKDDPEEILMFDYLIANADRHDENYLLTESGKIVAIDHGLALKRAPPSGGFKDVIESLVDFGENMPSFALARFLKKEKIQNPNKVVPKSAMAEVLRKETAHARALVTQEISTIVGTKKSYLKLKDTSDDQFRKLLGKQLPPEQIQHLLERRKEIVEAVEHARSRLGDQIFRAGPASPVREIHNDLAD